MQIIRALVGLIALSIVSCTNTSQSESHEFFISGNIEGIEQETIELYTYVDQKLRKVDSTESVNGSFSFTGRAEEDRLYMIKVGASKPIELFISPGEIVIEGNINDLENLSVSGSKAHNEFSIYRDSMAAFDNQLENKYPEYMMAQKNGDSAAMKMIEEEYRTIYTAQQEYLREFIGARPHSNVSAYLTYRMLYDSPYETLDSLYQLFSKEVQEGLYGEMLAERIEILKKVAIGQPLPDFQQTDTAGKMVSSAEFQGKYVLIDFWASWCSPCRSENPNIVAAFDKYHPMGFEVLGISLDQERLKWMRAIEEDSLKWTQVSDLKGWNNEVSRQFGIRAIPHSILVNPEGKIIAKDLRGKALHDKLEEIFNSKNPI